jgi:hypothetical protein
MRGPPGPLGEGRHHRPSYLEATTALSEVHHYLMAVRREEDLRLGAAGMRLGAAGIATRNGSSLHHRRSLDDLLPWMTHEAGSLAGEGTCIFNQSLSNVRISHHRNYAMLLSRSKEMNS